MRAQERFHNLFKGGEIDRLPIIEWAPWWNLTAERWNREGLNIPYDFSLQSVLKIQKAFNLDGCLQTCFYPVTAATPVAPSHGAGIAHSREEYEKIKPTLYPEPSTIYEKEHFEYLKKTREEDDSLHFFTVLGSFWFPRDIFGIEQHLFSFYDDAELYQDIIADYTKWLKKVIEFVGNTFRFDFMSFAEDMSYNNGPMIGKELFDEFIKPFYKEVVPLIKAMDVPIFVDSDGDIQKAVGWYEEAGADGMFPLERQAGVDVAEYLKDHPKMFFLGHFDKMCMKFGEEAIQKEFERLLPSIRTRHFIPSVDHQTPPDVSIENYRIYVKYLTEYAKKI